MGSQSISPLRILIISTLFLLSSVASGAAEQIMCVFPDFLQMHLSHQSYYRINRIDTKKYYIEVETMPSNSHGHFPFVILQDATGRYYAKFPSGNVFREEYIEVSVATIEELSEDIPQRNASLVSASFPVNSSLYSYTSTLFNQTSQDDPPVFSRHLRQRGHVRNAGTVDVEVSEYNGTTTLQLGPVNVTTLPDSIKMSFSCFNWTFQPSSAAWRFDLDLKIVTELPLLGLIRYDSYDIERDATKFEIATQKLNLTMWIQRYSVLDNASYDQNDLPFLIFAANPGPGFVFRQGFQFRRFSSLLYDPDFSILVTIPEPTTNVPRGPSQGGSTLDGADSGGALPAWIPVVIVLVVLIIVAIVIFGGLYARRRMLARADEKVKNVGKLLQDSTPDRGSSTQSTGDTKDVCNRGTGSSSASWKRAESVSTPLRNTNS